MKSKKRSLENIIEEFVEACIKRDEAQERGDAGTVNKQFTVIRKLKKELVSNPEYGIESLMPLLDHPNDYVRISTAYSMLPIIPTRAEAVLLEIAKKRGANGFIAELTLEEWKKGKLTFDYK